MLVYSYMNWCEPTFWGNLMSCALAKLMSTVHINASVLPFTTRLNRQYMLYFSDGLHFNQLETRGSHTPPSLDLYKDS